MREQDRVLRNHKEELVFASGGTRGVKTVGIVVFLLGLGLIGAALAQWGDMPHGPIPIYLAGSICFAVGIGIFCHRAETRFDVVSQHWRVSRGFSRFGGKRKGNFEELSEVVVDCDLAIPGEARSAQGPYLYEVRVKLKAENYINVRKSIRHAHHALSIAYELSQKLSLPLKNNAAGKDNIIEMIPPDHTPEPSNRLSTSKFDADTVTFFIPPGNRLQKTYQLSMGCTLAVVTSPLWLTSVLAAFIFWTMLDEWLRSGEIEELLKALIAAMFIILPLLLAYLIFARIYMAREELQASPSGICYRRIYGHWSRKKMIARGQITGVKLRVDKFAPTPRVEDITVFTRSNAVSVGHGLPDEEKTWIASLLRRILGMQQSDDR